MFFFLRENYYCFSIVCIRNIFESLLLLFACIAKIKKKEKHQQIVAAAEKARLMATVSIFLFNFINQYYILLHQLNICKRNKIYLYITNEQKFS